MERAKGLQGLNGFVADDALRIMAKGASQAEDDACAVSVMMRDHSQYHRGFNARAGIVIFSEPHEHIGDRIGSLLEIDKRHKGGGTVARIRIFEILHPFIKSLAAPLFGVTVINALRGVSGAIIVGLFGASDESCAEQAQNYVEGLGR